ncbi:zinc finger protein ZAT1 [Andrographis paniculata]|uniref:zinc finger protein ZAT1 n=1 Tax=Andrographis paniculata TaxID=175694 RepID=UPI0021E7FDDA|nr:zinc finger protein ZAT1 [Andrographis paniculata]
MEEDQELRFVCKLCNKKYPCGKSLGGHMRSHVVANSAESEEKTSIAIADPHPHLHPPPPKVPSSPFFSAAAMNHESFGLIGQQQQSNYGLRENPRKTWRAVDATFPLPQERVCKQCGKGFQSLKALCGHMASHSDRDKPAFLKDDHSWTSETHKLAVDSHSDTEEPNAAAEDRVLIRTRSSKANNKCKKIVVKSSSFTTLAAANNGSSSVSEIDGDEQEEVAICLMLLSRDSGNKGGVNSVVESSDNNSVIFETKSSKAKIVNKIGGDDYDAEMAEMENSDSGYFLDECGKAESDVSVDGFRRYSKPPDSPAEFRQGYSRDRGCYYRAKQKYNDEEDERRRSSCVSQDNLGSCSTYKKSKYECFNCKKIFKSYQALGGHRPCHKRSTVYCESQYSGDNSQDDDDDDDEDDDDDDDSAEFVKVVENRKSSAKKPSSKNYVDKKNSKAKKNKGHVCPFCNRIFKNGQALGGHKRSHFIGGHNHELHNSRAPAAKPDLLDLNLPAPEEDGNNGSGQFSPW